MRNLLADSSDAQKLSLVTVRGESERYTIGVKGLLLAVLQTLGPTLPDLGGIYPNISAVLHRKVISTRSFSCQKDFKTLCVMKNNSKVSYKLAVPAKAVIFIVLVHNDKFLTGC